MSIVDKNITLLSLLKRIERLGYVIITYQEAKDILDINAFEISNYYFTYFSEYKKYFVYNNYGSISELKKRILLFLKNGIKRGRGIPFLFINHKT